MMDPIYIDASDDSPKVVFDKEKEIFELSGKSLPEDVSAFYDPLVSWLEAYAEDPNNKTSFQVRLDYFNTASSKLILDIFMILEEMQNHGHEVEVQWYYPQYDEDMKEAGIEYSEMADIKFNFIRI